MGSPLRLTVVGLSERRAEETWGRVLAEFDDCDRSLSNYRGDSALVAANSRPGPIPADRRLRAALVSAHRAWRVTDGAFDPTVLRDLVRLGHPGLLAPPAADRGTGDWLCRAGSGRDIELRVPVDMGGIGKGLALRWAAGRLEIEGRGTRGYLLEAGGDLLARGNAPGGGPWSIGVEDAAGGPDAVAVIAASDVAICTSSRRIARWRQGERELHHLIDPRTGEPARNGLASVTVAARDPAWAEVWSKALFVRGGASIGPLARARGLAAWWVDDSGSLEMTPAARELTTWTRFEGPVNPPR